MTDPFETLEATWAPVRSFQTGKFTFREGHGGGKRVSASSSEQVFSTAELAEAEAQMVGLGQPNLFSVRHDQTEIDTVLAENGYEIVDPTVLLHCDINVLTAQPVPPVTCFPIWEPLQIMTDIWAKGGIGPARLKIMDRVALPKTGILGRINEKPGGTAFAAIHETSVMIHALEVLPHQRRSGMAGHMMRAAAHWGAAHGATDMMLAVTRANSAALALYSRLGMREIAGYHYRIKT